jgi:hypothetical protein
MEITTMTSRVRIDGKFIFVEEGDTIRDALRKAGMDQMPPSMVTGGEIIRAADYNRPVPSYDMITNQKDMVKGGSVRDRLLDQEVELIATRFLAEFPGRERSLETDDDTLFIGSFPLPDDYSPNYIDLLFVIHSYPEAPPAGIHLPSESPLRGQIEAHLNGHVHGIGYCPDSDLKYIKKFSQFGREWLCLYYRDNSWKINFINLMEGDCLYKFVENAYVALSGGHGD